jgi:imidazoleglycerol-phosphate dehydratase
MGQERTGKLSRESKETKISIEANLDGTGQYSIQTGVGFFDHMLSHLSKQSFIDLTIDAKGDTYIDSHHTVEDVGIVLGTCLSQAFGTKDGIKRYGFSGIPMDETMVLCSIDLSGRPYLSFNAPFTSNHLGDMDTEMVEEFFRALSTNLKMNCHIEVLHGKNNHHIAEGIFKAFGKALDEAKTIDPRIQGAHSTKGLFD